MATEEEKEKTPTAQAELEMGYQTTVVSYCFSLVLFFSFQK